jgi:predicted PhzF superfamily epimerase YddE/YHI9
MSIGVPVTVVRVFCDEAGKFGNPLGVVMDGPAVVEDDRQALARILGYSETVFVDDAAQGRVKIYTPEIELPFAGHPVIGTGWLLHREGFEVGALLAPAGKVVLPHVDAERCVARARAEWCPPWELVQHDSPEEVDALPVPERAERYDWAWIDEDAGTVRARAFVPEAGIPEDEATGSAAVKLCAALGRAIVVHQGEGSVIQAKPAFGDDGAPDDLVEFGGRVVLE